MSRKICLFAHYASENFIPDDVKHYLKQLSCCGWDIHVAFSGKTQLSTDTQQFCDLYHITPHLRPNTGLDFGAWKDLLNKGMTQNADHILFANDSVFGPIYPLQPIFSKMLQPSIDVWGMIESSEINWHFQSWFLCFTQKALAHEKIQNLFQQDFHHMSKPEIIQQGELKLGRVLQSLPDLFCKAAWSMKKFRLLRREAQTNPMHIDWYSVLQSRQVPFIKKEVIRDNYYGIFWLNHYRKLLKENDFFPLNHVDAYLANFSTRPLPVKPWWKRFIYLLTTYDTGLAWKYFMKQGVSYSFDSDGSYDNARSVLPPVDPSS